MIHSNFLTNRTKRDLLSVKFAMLRYALVRQRQYNPLKLINLINVNLNWIWYGYVYSFKTKKDIFKFWSVKNFN